MYLWTLVAVRDAGGKLGRRWHLAATDARRHTQRTGASSDSYGAGVTARALLTISRRPAGLEEHS